jgi:LytTr DNA-binding domain/Chromate transporter
MKPFDEDRLFLALDRAKEALNNQLKRARSPFRVTVADRGRNIRLCADDIVWMSAEDNYVRICCGRETLLVRATLNKLERDFKRDTLLRVHRSWIVNVNSVKEIDKAAIINTRFFCQTAQPLRRAANINALFGSPCSSDADLNSGPYLKSLLKLFGVLIALMEDEFVTRRCWLSREQFLDRLAASNLVPGPSSTEIWPGMPPSFSASQQGYERSGNSSSTSWHTSARISMIWKLMTSHVSERSCSGVRKTL